MTEGETFIDAFVQNTREIEFEHDLLNFKQSQKIKQQLVREKEDQIREIISQRQSQLFIQKKIRRSTFINQMRMKVANVKYQLCEQIFSEVFEKLKCISQQRDVDYQLILINYIVEGCIQMFEPHIKIHVLEKDLHLVQILKSDILKSFTYFAQQEFGQQIQLNIIIAENDCLRMRKSFRIMNKNEENEQAIGGVILSDLTGNILFKNTFDARLNILKQNALPMIRKMLWYADQGEEDECQ